ncbi:hypothetical protein KRR38_06860 [Novosphingobium sp. G106]|uniref:hypothetical protein n=1 Tax=Novosphingobium sp. G106 TaxID=2849500 RepID=UPI001C2DD363|nr:hypothetical protein [Novosphingobium sp. G106]MBV1687403.1 hypothetical protein [Novosphingobium sp. G106]
MTFATPALKTAALLLAAIPVAAATAQPVPAARPARPAAPKPAAPRPAAPKPAAKPAPKPVAVPAPVVPAGPPAWTVSSDEARGVVQIVADAKGATAHFSGGCSKFSSTPGMVGALSNYHGDGLRTDGEIEHVAFYARGADWQDAFSVRLRYSAGTHSWQFDRPLPPVFLNSFSRGATLAVVNSRNQEIFAFDLTGSTPAVRAMRTVCGIPTPAQ